MHFLQEKFSDYYSQRELSVSELHRREFGFGIHKKIDFRHRAFANASEFNLFLRKEAPLYASHSTAVYEFPDARPMERKIYLGSDLVFDLDVPSKDFAHEHNPVFCVLCLEKVKKDAVRVRDFLREDFGFKEFNVNYSGSKGFHFHLRSEHVRSLSQDARRQLVEYLSGPETLLSQFGKDGENEFLGPSAQSFGWGKKFYEFAYGFIESAGVEEFKAKGLRGKNADDFFKRKQLILGLIGKGKWLGPQKFWDALYAEFKPERAVSVDAHVTLDLARLIRVPGTLHGDTGFEAIVINPDRLASFEAGEAVVFKSERTINVLPHENISLAFPEKISLEKGIQGEVPLASGVLLLCKQKASLVLPEKNW